MKRFLLRLCGLSAVLSLGGCAEDCFDWRCEPTVETADAYEAQLAYWSRKDDQLSDIRRRYLDFVNERLIEIRYHQAQESGDADDYETFLRYAGKSPREKGFLSRSYVSLVEDVIAGKAAGKDKANSLANLFSKTPDSLTLRSRPNAEINPAKALEEAATESIEPAEPSLAEQVRGFLAKPSIAGRASELARANIEQAVDRGDLAVVFNALFPFAEEGDAQAQYLIGRMFDRGEGTTQDFEAAGRWYGNAHDQGHQKAWRPLSEIYKSGVGIPTDPAEALAWHRRAANKGDVEAKVRLGILYENGEGVAQDFREAVNWYRQAAEAGDANAQFLLGWVYAEGKGVGLDYIEAYSWFRSAEAKGVGEATPLLTLVIDGLSPAEAEEAQKRARERAAQFYQWENHIRSAA